MVRYWIAMGLAVSLLGVRPSAPQGCSVLGSVAAGSAPSTAAVAAEIRAALTLLAGDTEVQSAHLARLRELLAENRARYEHAGSPPQSAGRWFGGFRSGEPDGDYRLYWEGFRGLLRRAQRDAKPDFGQTVAALVRDLQSIVRHNAEWSEVLEEAIGDFALGAPEAYVYYLASVPAEHRDWQWGQMQTLCEAVEAKQLSDSLTDLVRAARLKGSASAAAIEARTYLQQGCTWPPSGAQKTPQLDSSMKE